MIREQAFNYSLGGAGLDAWHGWDNECREGLPSHVSLIHCQQG